MCKAFVPLSFFLEIMPPVLWLPLDRGNEWKHKCQISVIDNFGDCDGKAAWDYTGNEFKIKKFMRKKIKVDFYPSKMLRGVAYHKETNTLRGSSGSAIKGLCQSTTGEGRLFKRVLFEILQTLLTIFFSGQ